MRNTLCPGGVSDFRRNIQRCGMKLLVISLSGLYRRMFITLRPFTLAQDFHFGILGWDTIHLTGSFATTLFAVQAPRRHPAVGGATTGETSNLIHFAPIRP